MLRIDGLTAAYGAAQVLFGITLHIGAGEVVTMLGRNGMGKTTTIKALMGLVKPSGGRIDFAGRPIAGWPSHAIARLGLGLVPEGRQVFPTLSVEENLLATAANRQGKALPWTLESVYQHFPRLKERRRQSASTLSGGEQQMLAIGRALMTNPSLLILDEATEGLAPLIREDIWDCLAMLKANGQSILLVDKTIDALARLADRHYVIEKGRVVWSGPSPSLLAERSLIEGRIGI
jgi:branched-chain amino acid transport system ATP-binding protein